MSVAFGMEQPVPAPFVKWRSAAALTVGAVALFVVVRLLPTGTNLNHMDFRASGQNVIEFCDPTNPQFIPVVNVRSPVAMTLQTASPAAAGSKVSGVIHLRTASGKDIGPVDLLVTHTQKLHLLIIDPTLRDYQHVHPEPTRTPGEWTFSFTPRTTGVYRVFADFTPVATARGLYAHADLTVGGTDQLPAPSDTPSGRGESLQVFRPVEQDGYVFSLNTGGKPIRAGQQSDLNFQIARTGGGRVPLNLVMGAYAHLVAFDEKRLGFAHLHPTQLDQTQPPDAVNPVLNFKITIPNPGRYVLWAQTIIAGKDEFVPFEFTVAP